MVFGDEENDLGMLIVVKVGVVMVNVIFVVKVVIINVILSNDEDGVVVFLENYFNWF